jgi:hypothetical protein
VTPPIRKIYVNTGESIEDENMIEFRLIYEGCLPGSSASASDKHAIRRALHPQLRRVWKTKPTLSELARMEWAKVGGAAPVPNLVSQTPNWDKERRFELGLKTIGKNWRRAEHNIVPLVTSELALRCSLDILLLRPGDDKSIFKQGDLDNQVSTLFDGLKMPRDCSETGAAVPSEDEDPFYCLLEDDRLISEVHVASDSLLLLADRFLNLKDRDRTEAVFQEMLSDSNNKRNLSDSDKSAIAAALQTIQRRIEPKATDAFAIIHVKLNHKDPRTFDNYFD